MFQIEITGNALDDLRFLRKVSQTQIMDAIEQQLRTEPVVETRNRKRLRPNPVAEWELRVDEHRVFYDIDPASQRVVIKAVGSKIHNQLFIRGREFEL
jgi:mRNA-degrading endonuclease RelE of RelBE toxin-antitoxin system